MLVVLALGRYCQEDLWGSMTHEHSPGGVIPQEPSLLGEFYTSKRDVYQRRQMLKRKNWGVRMSNRSVHLWLLLDLVSTGFYLHFRDICIADMQRVTWGARKERGKPNRMWLGPSQGVGRRMRSQPSEPDKVA